MTDCSQRRVAARDALSYRRGLGLLSIAAAHLVLKRLHAFGVAADTGDAVTYRRVAGSRDWIQWLIGAASNRKSVAVIDEIICPATRSVRLKMASHRHHA